MAKSKDFLLDETLLTQVAKSLEEPISKTISTNIQKAVSVAHKNILYHNVGEALKYVGAQYVEVNCVFAGKTKGGCYFLFPTGEALNSAGTMMGLSPEELLDFMTKGYHADAEDAFKEIMSQVIGQISTTLRSTYKDVKGEVKSTKDINILEDLKEFEVNVEGDEFVFLVYEIAFDGEESFISYLVISKELAFSLAPLEGAVGGVSSNESESLEVVSKEELEGNVEILRRIQVPIIVTLAQKRMTIEDIMKQLSVGSIIEFNVAFDSYLDLQIGDKKIGEGEVVTVNDVYGLQIKSILSARETLETLM